MNLHRTIVALGAAALLVAPATAAFAQQGPPPWANGNNGQYQRHDRDDNDRDDRGDRGRRHEHEHEHEHHDRGRHNGWNNPNNPHSGYNNGQYGGYNRGQYGQYGRNGNGISGTVSSFSPFNLYLQNGTHVELHQGTVINPTGATPQPGQRAQITGHWNSDGTFAADQINLY